MTQKELIVGLTYSDEMSVQERHTVPSIEADWPGFSAMPPVFATATMVAFMEETCIRALKHYLMDSQRSVGTHVNMSHVAATPIDATVKAEVELISVEGKMLEFKVACYDNAGLIGKGFHKRTIIDVERFKTAIEKKRASLNL